MGFIKAVFQSVGNSFSDALYKEYISIPDGIDDDIIAIKGVRFGNDNNKGDLISDGSLIIIPQGYVALAIRNGKFIEDIAIQAGAYTWNTETNSTLLGNKDGFFKGLGNTFKNVGERITYGGVKAEEQSIVFIKTQPILSIKFGTKGAVEIFSKTYRNVGVIYYGDCDMYVHDPILFYEKLISKKFETDGEFRFSSISEKIRQQVAPEIRTNLVNFAKVGNMEVPEMNTQLANISNASAVNITNNWSKLYGLGISRLTIEDISYDEKSQERVNMVDENLITLGNGFLEIERQRAQNEAMVAMAKNEAKGSNMNAMMGVAMMPQMMGMVQGAFNQTQNVQNTQPQNTVQAPTPNTATEGTTQPIVTNLLNPTLDVPEYMKTEDKDPFGLIDE